MAQLPEQRRLLLRLLARFELTAEQAHCFYQEAARDAAGIHAIDRQLLDNPYLLYELSRGLPEPVAVTTVDRGALPPPAIATAHPLPTAEALEELDPRRVRALAVDTLEAAAGRGDTLQPRNQVIQAIRDLVGVGVDEHNPVSLLHRPASIMASVVASGRRTARQQRVVWSR